MNGTPTDLPATELSAPPIHNGWSGRRLLLLIAFALAVHVVMIFSFGTTKHPVPRPVTNVPQLKLASRLDELVALENPALFALPNPRDFASVVWRKTPGVTLPAFGWTETPRWLPLSQKDLGAVMSQFMSTNIFARSPLNFKPVPQFILPALGISSALPEVSTLQVSPNLEQRQLIAQPSIPVLSRNDVVAPSRVRIVVDTAGNVISSVLLPAGNTQESAGSSTDADDQALVLARSLRFKPAPDITLGSVIFYWHTIPLVTTNAP
jgi:hypothetical protein